LISGTHWNNITIRKGLVFFLFRKIKIFIIRVEKIIANINLMLILH
jgi:hypothetical protein